MLYEIVAFFMDGGPYMYAILFSDKVLLVLTLIAIALNKPRLLTVSLAAAFFPFLLGGVSYISDMKSLEAALEYAGDPEYKEALVFAAKEVAIKPVKFGFWSSLIFILPLGVRIWCNRKSGQLDQAVENA